MLENLINLVREHAGTLLNNNPAIPPGQTDAVVTETGSTIIDKLKEMISQGGGQDVLNLLQNAGESHNPSNPVVQNISGGLIQNLMNKFGINQDAAGGIAGNLIPNVLHSLVNKVNDPNDNSFDLQGIISHLTGGQGIQSLLGNLEQGGGAGILNSVKGLFGNS